ncbi:MAG TPA: hypothetical protein VNH17_04030 [Streptosporangiaceae bacterium]|nr:hypothetical protein [Streptosporangiaceae bacterium]
MTDVDLAGLRKQFPADVIGKLPKVTCRDCSKGSCGDHRKEKCRECGNYISTAHIHIDYVGHADVTDRLLEVDPEWDWQPMATDPDPEILKAAIASGNPDIVRLVIENAPPKLERNASGYPVGLWMRLKVGETNRIGYGSVPASQMDAEKVLIGDGLRNAAMRGGVALDLWAKGDRADPTAENSTGSGSAERHARKPEQPRGQVSRQPARAPTAAGPAPDLGGWGIRIDGLNTDDDFDAAKAELDAAVAGGNIPAARANAILAAMKARRAAVTARREHAA